MQRIGALCCSDQGFAPMTQAFMDAPRRFRFGPGSLGKLSTLLYSRYKRASPSRGPMTRAKHLPAHAFRLTAQFNRAIRTMEPPCFG